MAVRTATKVTVPVAALLALAGCGGSDEVTSSTLAEAPSTTAPPTTVPATTMPPPTTVSATTAPPTTSPATTLPPPTTAPATTAPPTTSPATTLPAGPKPTTFFATTDLGLDEVDVATGATTRVIDPFFGGDGVFRGGLRASPDRSVLYFSEGYEDSWYACDTSIGSIGSIDVASGEVTTIDVGGSLQLGPDGSTIVNLDSQTCLPDPQQPDLWVLTPYDRVIVRDVVGGSLTEYLTATPPDGYEAPSAIRWADMAADGSVLVQTAAGEIHRIPAGATGAIQDFPVVATTDASPWEVIGDTVIATFFGAEGSSDLVTVSLVDGSVTPLASAEVYMAVGVDDVGHVIAAADGEITVEPGADVTVVDFPVDAYYYDLEW